MLSTRAHSETFFTCLCAACTGIVVDNKPGTDPIVPSAPGADPQVKMAPLGYLTLDTGTKLIGLIKSGMSLVMDVQVGRATAKRDQNKELGTW